MADPTNLRALDEIRFQTGMSVDPVVVEQSRLAQLLHTLAESTSDALRDLTGEDFDMDLLDQGVEEKPEEDNSGEVDDAPVVRFIQKMLIDAINEGASDIHFEPYEKYLPDPFPHRWRAARDRPATADPARKIAARSRSSQARHLRRSGFRRTAG